MRFAAALAGTVTLLALAGSAEGHTGPREGCGARPAPLMCAIQGFRLATWELQDKLGRPRTRTAYADRRTSSVAFKIWIRDLWHDRYHVVLKAWNDQSSYLNWWQWDALAACETGGNWSAQGPTYQGGLGIHYGVWDEFGGGEFAANAGDASREEQITVGYRIWLKYGWSPWGCASQVGL